MANTFLAAEGYDLGASKIEGDKLDLAREILAAAKMCIRDSPCSIPC